ncbi:MAG: tripartite tricarboxylate transporter substrate-binding protein [Proteobacteria bacterium]|nr:tripartite tricarboxylate transporter substrate-binding protein [Pseudomonadota bacterium]
MRMITAALPAALGTLGCVLAWTAGQPAAFAQAFPSKPLRIVIPWPPGGANDIAGRTVMLRVADMVGQPVVIDNRGGAGGTIGTGHVAKSPADGYTLLVQSVTHVANAHLYSKLPYDTLRDFAPVALLTAQTAVLVVHPSLPVKSVKDFVALARARPDQLMYSTAGNGSIPHLSMALLGSMTGTKLVHVPYKCGGPQVVGPAGRTDDCRGGRARLRAESVDRPAGTGGDPAASGRSAQCGGEPGTQTAGSGVHAVGPGPRSLGRSAGGVRRTPEGRLRHVRQADRDDRGAGRVTRGGTAMPPPYA